MIAPRVEIATSDMWPVVIAVVSVFPYGMCTSPHKMSTACFCSGGVNVMSSMVG